MRRKTNFLPPMQPESIIGRHEASDGSIDSLSLLLRDANNKLFTLHVATGTNFIDTANEFPDEVDDGDSEPVFVIPELPINDQLLDSIIAGISPDVLSMYLVEQEL